MFFIIYFQLQTIYQFAVVDVLRYNHFFVLKGWIWIII